VEKKCLETLPEYRGSEMVLPFKDYDMIAIR